VLDPRNTWADKAAYDAMAKDLATRFRGNDAKYTLSEGVRKAGPKA
jgi:phosphoenolpyruvate carboxykinase (ATP)